MNVVAERAACEILVMSMAIAAIPTLVIGYFIEKWRNQ